MKRENLAKIVETAEQAMEMGKSPEELRAFMAGVGYSEDDIDWVFSRIGDEVKDASRKSLNLSQCITGLLSTAGEDGGYLTIESPKGFLQMSYGGGSLCFDFPVYSRELAANKQRILDLSARLGVEPETTNTNIYLNLGNPPDTKSVVDVVMFFFKNLYGITDESSFRYKCDGFKP